MPRLLTIVCILAGCQKTSASPQMPEPIGRDHSIYFRALTDDDPRAYLGRFVPDDVPDDEVDESRAVETPCSEYVVPTEVSASERKDLVVSVSDGGRVALGIPSVGQLRAGAARTDTIRIHYALSGRIIGKIEDTDGFQQCCASSPQWCSGRYIGEFLRGQGTVYRGRARQSGVDLAGGHSGVRGAVGYAHSAQWERAAAFDDGYFAFRVTEARLGTNESDASDCGWVERPPSSSGGTYVVGISPLLGDESTARQAAFADAQAQVVSYLLGESVEREVAVSKSSSEVAASVETALKTSAAGSVRGVKMLRWCIERVPTPRGEHVVAKVLGYLATADRPAAAAHAVEQLIEAVDRAATDSELIDRLEQLRRDLAAEGQAP